MLMMSIMLCMSRHTTCVHTYHMSECSTEGTNTSMQCIVYRIPSTAGVYYVYQVVCTAVTL